MTEYIILIQSYPNKDFEIFTVCYSEYYKDICVILAKQSGFDVKVEITEI
jgi:hypothetical protein